jgi:hypothetical protein
MSRYKPLSYYLGLDLGQSADYSALAIIEEPVWILDSASWVSPSQLPPDMLEFHVKRARKVGRPANPPLYVSHLQRFPLGTKYTAVVDEVKTLTRTPPLLGKPAALLVDKTGVGAGVIDHFEHRGINPIAVTITGRATLGAYPHSHGRSYRVPKRDLVGAVQVLLQNGRLKIAERLPEAVTLRKELQNFRVKIDPKTAHDSYEHWREGDHDDLVLAVAMTCWFREWWQGKWETHFARREERERRAIEDRQDGKTANVSVTRTWTRRAKGMRDQPPTDLAINSGFCRDLDETSRPLPMALGVRSQAASILARSNSKPARP